jgi:Flp pilus assembly protein TadD
MKEDTPDVDSLEQMVEDDPEDPAAWLAYGKALLEVNRNDEAVQALEKSLQLNPNAVDVRYHLGDALAEDGRLDEAAQQFWYLACDDPELEEPLSVPGLSALMRRADCQGALGRWSEAVSTVRPAVLLAVDALGHVAYIHQMAGAHEQAAALYSICLLLTPGDPGLLHGAGYNKMKLGDLEEALNDLGQALKLDPKTPELWYDYGIVLARMKRRSEARPIFRKALRLDAKFFWAWYDLACLDALEGKPAAAFRNLSRAIDCGFKDAAYLLQDQDFHGIREDPRWKMILDRIQEPAPNAEDRGGRLLRLKPVHGIQ